MNDELVAMHWCYLVLSICIWFQANTALSLQQEKRLKQMGATVRNASAYMERLKMSEERKRVAKAVMGKMSIEQLSDLMSFYSIMSQICSDALETKFHDPLNNEADS